MKGYGHLITRAREAQGKDIKRLARDIGQSVSTVRRLESEETEPDVEQINALVSSLPLSAEDLLVAMGLKLTLPLAARIPYQLAELLAAMPVEGQEGMTRFLRELASRTERGQR